jgi:glyoxylase-like metal-dependent hydrolase (beta-lactamase superfamily II)
MATEIFPVKLSIDTCYVLRGDGIIVIDAGPPDKAAVFCRGLDRAGIQARDVSLILLTHAHWDHMGSAGAIREITGAPLAVHEEEVGWVEQGNPTLPAGITAWGRVLHVMLKAFTPGIGGSATPVDIRLTESQQSLEEFGIQGTVVHTPGHSPGSVSVILESGEAFVGDLAMNLFPLTLRPGLPVLGDDADLVVASWRKILPLGIKRVYPAHGKPFSLDVSRRAVA